MKVLPASLMKKSRSTFLRKTPSLLNIKIDVSPFRVMQTWTALWDGTAQTSSAWLNLPFHLETWLNENNNKIEDDAYPNWEHEFCSSPTLITNMQPTSVMYSSFPWLSTANLEIFDIIAMSEVRQDTGICRIISPVSWSSYLLSSVKFI